MTLTILLSSLLSSDRVITNMVLVVSTTIIVGIPANLVPTFRFNTSFPKVFIKNGYLKFYG